MSKELAVDDRLRKQQIIEFAGLPKSGKTTILDAVVHYFNRTGVDTQLFPDAGVTAPIGKNTIADLNCYLATVVAKQVLEWSNISENLKTPNLNFIDRGVFDRVIWTRALEKMELIKQREADAICNFLLEERLAKRIAGIFVFVCDVDLSLKREQKHKLIYRPGRVMNEPFLEILRETALEEYKNFRQLVEHVVLVDTTEIDQHIGETTRYVVDQIGRILESEEKPLNSTFSEKEFKKEGEFLVDMQFEKLSVAPPVIRYKGQPYFRYMDFFFSPIPVSRLGSTQAIDLCDLRLKYADKAVSPSFNASIVSRMATVARLHQADLPVDMVLDFGAGAGASMQLLQDCIPKAKFFGVDASTESVAYAQKQGVDVRHVSLNGSLPFEDAVFQIVFAVFVFHFKVGPDSLREISRVLKTGGLLVFNIYNQVPARILDELSAFGLELVDMPNNQFADIPENHSIHVCRKC